MALQEFLQRFDKKSYAVTTVDGDGTEQDRRIMGMEAAHDWALHGPFLDKTLMRNYIAMNFSLSLGALYPLFLYPC